MTRNESTYRGAGRAVVLAALVVLSAVTVSVGMAGTLAAAQDSSADADRTYTTPEALAGDDVWIGQTIEISGLDPDSSGAEIRTGFADGDGETVETTAVSGTTVTFETDDLEDGEVYHLVVHGDDSYDGAYEFWAYQMQFEAAFDDDAVADGESVGVEFDSERSELYDVNVSAEGLEAAELERIFSDHDTTVRHDEDDVVTLVDVGNADDLTAEFSDVDFGEYEFVFDVRDTVDEDTATITVREDNEDYAFVDVEQVEQGDIANITLEVTDSDSAAVVLGDRQDNFRSAVELEDVEDERVVLRFNTHAAATEDAWSVHENSNASIENAAVGTPLEQGEAFPAHRWDLSVGDQLVDTFELENEFDRDVLSVRERSAIGEAAIRTAPADARISDLESFREATVTRTNTVAEADALVLTVEDFGAEGAITALEDGSALADDGLVVEIEERDPGPVADAHVWNSSVDESDGSSDVGGSTVDPLEVELINAGVNADEYEGDLHFLVTYESDSYDRNLAVGEDYDVTFTVTDDNAYVDDGEEIERELTLELVERELEWDPISAVPADENATATGSTTVAPGTELRATADSPVEEGGFVQMTDVVVEEGTDGDHQFAATFDFSVTEPGILFDLIIEDSYDPDENVDVLEDVELMSAVHDSAPSAPFTVSAQAPPTATVGDDAALEVTVENAGDEAGTSNYSVVIDGEQVDEAELELEAGESVDRRYEFDTSAPAELEWEVATDHDDAFGTLTVESDAEDAAEDGADDTVTEDGDAGGAAEDDEGTPGFGVAVAVAAVLVAAALAARRDR